MSRSQWLGLVDSLGNHSKMGSRRLPPPPTRALASPKLLQKMRTWTRWRRRHMLHSKNCEPCSPVNLFYSFFYSIPWPSPAQIAASFSRRVFILPNLVHNVEVHRIHIHFFHLFFWIFSKNNVHFIPQMHSYKKIIFFQLYIVNPPLLPKKLVAKWYMPPAVTCGGVCKIPTCALGMRVCICMFWLRLPFRCLYNWLQHISVLEPEKSRITQQWSLQFTCLASACQHHNGSPCGKCSWTFYLGNNYFIWKPFCVGWAPFRLKFSLNLVLATQPPGNPSRPLSGAMLHHLWHTTAPLLSKK